MISPRRPILVPFLIIKIFPSPFVIPRPRTFSFSAKSANSKGHYFATSETLSNWLISIDSADFFFPGRTAFYYASSNLSKGKYSFFSET